MTNIHQSRSSTIIVVNVVFLALSYLAVALRLLSRWMSTAHFWWDDLFAVIGLVLLSGTSTLNFLGAANGAGNHFQIVNPAQVVTLDKIIFGVEVLYGVLLTAIKTSILFFYLRLFGVHKRLRCAVVVVETVVIVWCVALFFASIFQSKPVRGLWEPDLPSHHVNFRAYLLGTAVPNVVVDFVILVLPLPVVWQLQMSNRRKTALTAVFLIGACVCGVSIIRAYAVANVNEQDKTYAYADALVWTSVECNVGIICACLPTLSTVLQALHQRMSGRRRDTGPSETPNNMSRSLGSSENSRVPSGVSVGPFQRLDNGLIKLPSIPASNASTASEMYWKNSLDRNSSAISREFTPA